MTIRWRLGVLAVQLLVLGVGTALVLGELPVTETWFIAGLFTVVINRQLLEPFYPRPADVLGNAFIGLGLWLAAERSGPDPGWLLVLFGVILAGCIGLAALIGGAGRQDGPGVGLGRVAAQLSQRITSQLIFSSIFFVSLLGYIDPSVSDFWWLVALWFVLVLLGTVNWQRLWGSLHVEGSLGSVEGLVGPGRLLVSAPAVPQPGSRVEIVTSGDTVPAVVATRIRRRDDTWAELVVASSSKAESLLQGRTISLRTAQPDSTFVGIVEEGSSVDVLRFVAVRRLHVGAVVGVDDSGETVLFQITRARVERKSVSGGAQLVTVAEAVQLGVFDVDTCRLTKNRWVVPAGAIVREVDAAPVVDDLPDHLFRLGTVLYTQIPVYLDLAMLCEGHTSVLGMTKMGKSTLTHRLSAAIAADRRTVVLDATGEYAKKKGLVQFDKNVPWHEPSLTVLEPPDGTVRPDYALKCVDKLMEIASGEYNVGDPTPRVLVFEEAHDFFPEPASLGFNAPGRDSSYSLGLRMMQVRKYGMSFLLVSQRTAVVSKSALSQCENLIVFRSVDRTGLDYLEDLSGTDVRSIIPTLKQGEAVVFGPAVSADGAVAVKVDLPT